MGLCAEVGIEYKLARWRAFARLCENEEKFYEEVDFRGDQKLEWDKIQNEDEYDFSIEED